MGGITGPATMLAESPEAHHEVALRGDIAGPKAKIGQFRRAIKITVTEGIPCAYEDAVAEPRWLDDPAKYGDFRLGVVFMHRKMRLERVAGHEDVIRHQ